MPWLLYRYILSDLLRIIGLTTLVLVTVIAFGATLKPLTRGGLDAVQIAKYLGLAIVPMLQFALPFSAGFGATLSLYRMTTDNEIQAMAAGGISYHRILSPIAALGIALTIIMVILTQWVIPQFWGLIAQTVTADATRLFQASIERGEPFQFKSTQIFADRLVVQNNPEGDDGPVTRMILLNVAAADLDKAGRIVTDVTAAQAIVDIYRNADQTYLKMVMNDTVAFNAETGQLVHSDRFAPRRAIAVPRATSENTKALTRPQMLALRDAPDAYGPVMRAKQALANAIVEIERRQAIDLRLRDAGELELVGEHLGEGFPVRTLIVRADRMLNDGRFIAQRNKPVEIMQYENGEPALRFLAESAQLGPALSPTLGAASFDLTLGNHDVINLGQKSGIANRRARLVIPNLSLREQNEDDLSAMSSSTLIARAEGSESARERLKQGVEKVRHEINLMHHEISGRLLSRHALSLTAFLLLMLGAMMAMWQRGSLPLVTYIWAFVPSIIDLIVISAGEQLLRDGQGSGYLVMWSGNALLLGMFVIAYWRVSRN